MPPLGRARRGGIEHRAGCIAQEQLQAPDCSILGQSQGLRSRIDSPIFASSAWAGAFGSWRSVPKDLADWIGASLYAYQGNPYRERRVKTPSALGLDQERKVFFRPSDPCLATGVVLEGGAKYEVVFTRIDGWSDANIPVGTTEGFASNDDRAPWYMGAFAPIKRNLGQLWFKPEAQVGSHAQTEYTLDRSAPLSMENRSGELFLYVNDAVLGLPGIWDYFYRNNRGEGTVTIRKVADGPRP